MKDTIKEIVATQILDSRGVPTVQARVITKRGALGEAQVPSGTSTGVYEALELRDGNPNHYRGKSVLNAVKNINKLIAKKLVGLPVTEQILLDETMIKLDGTKNKSRLGANAILAVSLAAVRAAAASEYKPLYHYLRPKKQHALPMPLFNVINGGAHASNGLSVQEIKLVPVGAKNFHQALEVGSNIFQVMRERLEKKGESSTVGYEGGYAPKFVNTEEALQFIVASIKAAGYVPESEVAIALDVAASEFFSKGNYTLDGVKMKAEALAERYSVWIEKFPIVSIEDPFDQDDWDSWIQFTARHGSHLQIIGDDLLVTNPERVEDAIARKAVNAVLIKLNQIGTLTETLQVMHMTHAAGMNCVVSHRSGETNDTTISDLAVGHDATQIKAGSLSRGERLAKYNRLLEIEDELGKSATFQNPFKK